MQFLKNSRVLLPLAAIVIVAVAVFAIYGSPLGTVSTPAEQKTTAPAQTTETPTESTPPAQETVAPSTPTTPAFSVTVAVEKPSYKADQNIKISGTSLPETSITLEVTNQFGTTTRTRLLTTDASGNYEDNFKLSSKTTKGTYTVKVTASKGGETATATTTFEFTL